MIYSPFDRFNNITNVVLGVLVALIYVLIRLNDTISNWWIIVPILLIILFIVRFLIYESIIHSCYAVIKDFIENGVHFDDEEEIDNKDNKDNENCENNVDVDCENNIENDTNNTPINTIDTLDDITEYLNDIEL